MRNFSIYFSHPWLLLLIIPAIAFTLIPYFMLSKKYRKTRNRITSIVLHCIIMVLAISVLAGIEFRYQVPNPENEVIFLVDVSDTQQDVADKRDDFLRLALNDGRDGNVKIGVVTFGFDQMYAVPFTRDVSTVFQKYQKANKPNTSATDIAAALEFAKDLFENPETAKIVLVTDGKETDEEAMAAIRLVSAGGTKVDVAYISSQYIEDDLQVVGVEMPDYHVNSEEQFSLGVTVYGNHAAHATITVSDNGVIDLQNGRQDIDMSGGLQTVMFNHTFDSNGLHELKFSIESAKDSIDENNEYTTYINVELFNNILILERYKGQSDYLKQMLTAGEKYKVTVANIESGENIPASVDELRVYDQIILNNISNKDLTEYMVKDFDKMLESYVKDYGGGLFTVGGNDESGDAHSYKRTDMYGTTYQSLLPVQAIDYTPPVGLMVIIDRSGSMEGEPLVSARAGAAACIEALTERDYMGIMTLDSDYNVILPLTPCTQERKIKEAIDSVQESTGGTVFDSAIERAAQALISLKTVDKRHIIIVTDGQPGGDAKDYEDLISFYYNGPYHITVSMVLIGVEENSSAAEKMKHATDLCRKDENSEPEGKTYASTNHNYLINAMREDLKADSIKEVNIPEGGFQPIVYNEFSPIVKNVERDSENGKANALTVKLDGFYGVKVRSNDYLVLTGDYDVPLYAQWKYGKGSVGSFMCDLNGNWSANFISDTNGQTLVLNVIKNLLPAENIHPKEINVELNEGNYLNQLSIYGALKDGEYIKGRIESTGEDVETLANFDKIGGNNNDGSCYVTLAMTEANNYSRCNFVLNKKGVYKIILVKYDANGNELATYETYKKFSYSKEYDLTVEDENTLKSKLAYLSEKSNGAFIADIEDPVEIYSSFVVALDRVYDPRLALIITAIVLFLLDIAVRKFKFKWLHEIIRDRKNKKK